MKKAISYGFNNRKKLLLLPFMILFIAGHAQPTQLMISDKITHQPVPFAQVTILLSGEKKPLILLSDQKGTADIPVVPPFVISIKSTTCIDLISQP